MSTKSKGSNAEREVLHKFWKEGWACIRTAGSGSISHPMPDLLAGNGIRRVAIECKCISDDTKYFPKKEIQELGAFSRFFGAEAWVGIKFGGKGWFFLNLEDLRETEKGYVADTALCEMKGLSFEDLIS